MKKIVSLLLLLACVVAFASCAPTADTGPKDIFALLKSSAAPTRIVSDITYSGKVLARRFRPTMTREEFAASQVTAELRQTQVEFSAPSFVMAMLKTEKDNKKKLQEIQELEQLLEEYKKTM